MYPPPSGPDLTVDECRNLDDAFFASDPTAFFRSRIDSLLDWADRVPTGSGDPVRARAKFQELIGSAASARYPTTPDQQKLQVAADAVQVRHHVAEALLRLMQARLKCRASEAPCSLWAALTEGPIQLQRLLEDLGAVAAREDYGSVLAGLILPIPNGTVLNRPMMEAVHNASLWLARAVEIVSAGEINIGAASNKLKHGVAVRPEDRLRLTLTTEPPDENGDAPLPSLTGGSAFDIFDTIVLEYLVRPPKERGHEANGLERTLLRVDPPVVLAEAWMLAILHGAMFDTAAYRHHGDQTAADVADHPGLALHLTPQGLLGTHVVGMRFPVTTSPSGRTLRPAGMQMTDGTFLTLTFGKGQRGVVVAE